MADSTPVQLCSHSLLFQAMQMRSSGLAADAAFTWPAANRAIYQPFSLVWSYSLARIGWWNGGTVSGNVAVAVYAVPGWTVVYNGAAAAQASVASPQYHVLAAPQILAGGSYALAISFSSATATVRGSSLGADQGRFMGLLQQDAAHPLPATATPVAFSGAAWPLLSISRKASG